MECNYVDLSIPQNYIFTRRDTIISTPRFLNALYVLYLTLLNL